MSLQSVNGGSLRRYLLGELSEQEREQVEQRLMTDDDLYQQLMVAEDELIDEYISGALPDQDREKFGRTFLRVPELRQDVRFTAALRRHALKTVPQPAPRGSHSPPRFSPFDWLRKFFMRPALGFAFAAAFVAAVLLAVWLAAQNSRLREEVGQLQARATPPPAPSPDLQEQLASERLRSEQLLAELQRQRELLAEESARPRQAREQEQQVPARRATAEPGAGRSLAFALTSGAVRESGEMKKISVTPGLRELRIRLDLPAGDYRNLSAAVETVEGREVLPRRGLRGGAGFVTLRIPARLLGPDDYRIVLSSVGPSGESEEINYYFRVLK